VIGLGTIINTAAILLGGLLGGLFGRYLSESTQETLTKCCGVSTLLIAVAGTMMGMLTIENGQIESTGAMLVIISLAVGGIIGELLNIEGAFERFGCWLKVKTGNARDKQFVDAFVTASLTVCIGAMAIVGAIEDGMAGDISILAAKSVLDLVIVCVMAASMGKGCIFSFIPVGLLQGSVTALSLVLKPIMTDAALSNLSYVGSVLIFCVGVNLVWGKKVKVANMLPAVVIAVVWSFFG
jgi:uncharacterized membrane protein YqgA involved in biofilm formation